MNEEKKPVTPRKAAKGIHEANTISCATCSTVVSISNRNMVHLYGRTNAYRKIENAIGIIFDKELMADKSICRTCVKSCETILKVRGTMREYLTTNRLKRVENFTSEKDMLKKTRPLTGHAKCINFDEDLPNNKMQVRGQVNKTVAV